MVHYLHSHPKAQIKKLQRKKKEQKKFYKKRRKNIMQVMLKTKYKATDSPE